MIVESHEQEAMDKLRTLLNEAQQTILEQDDILDRLTAAPFPYGLVVNAGYRMPEPELFKLGTRVKVLRGDFQGKVGKVIGELDHDGDISVYFSVLHESNYYKVAANEREREIEPLEGSHVSPLQYRLDSEVRILSSRHGDQGKKGTIVGELDTTGYVRVHCGGYNDAYFVGLAPTVAPVGFSFGFAAVIVDGRILEVNLPDDKAVKAGDTVKLNMETLQIVDVVGDTIGSGDIAIVRNIKDEMSEVEIGGVARAVHNGRFQGQLEVGDKVILDATQSAITGRLGQDDARYQYEGDTGIRWSDIGGLEEAKEQMVEAIEEPYQYAEFYAHYNKKPIKGILMSGPPGCGKTMLAKAAVTALQEIFGKEQAASGFIYVKGPEILERWVGNAEANIRQLFARARKHKETHGYPAIIFIDEADAILSTRGSGISSDMEKTIVPMFLAEMDGLEDSGAIMILATNRPDILDPAIVRDKRMDRKVYVGRPDHEAAVEIFKLYLKDMPLDNGYSVPELAKFAADELFSPSKVLYEVQLDDGSVMPFTLAEVCNGGMIAGIVDQASSIALHRDIQENRHGGLRISDLQQSVASVLSQNANLNHSDELASFVGEKRDRVKNVRRLKLVS